MKIEGTLPVAMLALVGQQTVKTKNIVMVQQTTEQYYQAQATALPGQWIEIIDLASMTKLVDENSKEIPVSYEMLASTSRQNRDYLISLRSQLDAKEIAESEDIPSVESEDSIESA
ncbi:MULTISPECIES: hypothetical protein [unclassified Acinetobacter]|uniref:hypothetical protein n=1 Tax=unclassified Acinetobacter TaxID=196816 RepID=UPI00190959A7|nr:MULTISPECIES: hypothetical protein [unclassified Acinetobacter]MBK0062382.1 hypothetical protein [Acinetobacter sp. S55]MBK0066186.1 hypothetical protein [Acinetobacter sp. S54]